MHDIVIERQGTEEVVAVSPTPAAAGERMSVDVLSPDAHVTLTVTAVASVPIIVDGGVRYRLRLRIAS